MEKFRPLFPIVHRSCAFCRLGQHGSAPVISIRLSSLVSSATLGHHQPGATAGGLHLARPLLVFLFYQAICCCPQLIKLAQWPRVYGSLQWNCDQSLPCVLCSPLFWSMSPCDWLMSSLSNAVSLHASRYCKESQTISACFNLCCLSACNFSLPSYFFLSHCACMCWAWQMIGGHDAVLYDLDAFLQ